MKPFADLCARLEVAAGAEAVVALLRDHARQVPAADAAAALALLTGTRPARVASAAELRDWACAVAGVPGWLFDDCLRLLRDLAETVALILPGPEAGRNAPGPGLAETVDLLRGWRGVSEADRRAAVSAAWRRLDTEERRLFTRLVLGTFRQQVGAGLAALALGAPSVAPLPPVARVLAADPATLGPAGDWLAEWEVEGLAVVIDTTDGRLAVRSRDHGLIGDRLPELAMATLPPGSMIEALLVAMGPEGQPRPASALQPRLGRPRLTPAVIAATPLRVVARDLWAWAGADLRQLPAGERRARLAGVAASAGLHPAAALPTGDWPEWRAALTGARDRGATGLRLRRDAPGLGEVWHWPAPAHSLCATLIHAEVGPGGGLVSLTLGLQDGADWVPVAKVAADLPAPERAALAGWVRQNTIARFGPVRQVPPEQVFDLAFDRADPSPRHKAGLVLRGARLTGWQRDAAPGGCATLAGLRAIALAGQENCP